MRVHPRLLVPDPTRSLNEGAFVTAAINNTRDSWGGRLLYSLAAHFGFSLDAPFEDLAERHVQVLLLFSDRLGLDGYAVCARRTQYRAASQR